MTYTPEKFGYKIGDNIVPYINRCIEQHGECYIGEGIHVFGRNDKDWIKGFIWSDNCITWGWGKKNNVKITGAGRDKTILRFIDNVQSRYLLDKDRDIVFMVHTNYDESCNDNIIENITFDGNYDNNNETSTLCAIRIRGSNNTVKNCSFINFGVGNSQKHECFQLALGPIDKNERGPNILNNYFSRPGKKSNSTTTHVPENTLVAVGGIDCVVKDNVFENVEFDCVNQQSPLHGITIGNSKNAQIINNHFINFQGSCIYTDSWTNQDFLVENNIATNVWRFMQLSCQNWDDKNQISFNKNGLIKNNIVKLSIGNCYYHWAQPPFVSNFIGYINDPTIDHEKYTGFENIIVENNDVTLGYRNLKNSYEESTKLFCFWGNNVSDKKIKLINNKFISQIPNVSKKSIFKKIIDWFINLFR